MKKHLPRKYNDTNIIRCILININEHFDTAANDYKIDYGRFRAMIDSLLKAGVIAPCSENAVSTVGYCISDTKKYAEWEKSDFYRAIEKYVLPLLPVAISVAGIIQ